MDFFHTHISKKAIENVNQVLQTGWISEGKLVKAFESELSSRLKLPRPVALNSGTSALHLALVVAGVGLGMK
jgi:perosamine synthetase